MKKEPTPPKTYQNFIEKYPKLSEAWNLVAEAGNEGPLDEKTTRLIKLAIAIGAMREGAVRSSVRKALALGIEMTQLDHMIKLAVSTLGFPSTVAVYDWIEDEKTKSMQVK